MKLGDNLEVKSVKEVSASHGTAARFDKRRKACDGDWGRCP
jgi:hypothetical protein